MTQKNKDTDIKLSSVQNDQNRLALLWTLLNISTEILYDTEITAQDAMKILRAIEKKIDKSKILNTIWQMNYEVWNNNKLIHKRHLDK